MNRSSRSVVDASGRTVARCFSSGIKGLDDRLSADARLIAAAPTMYDELVRIAIICDAGVISHADIATIARNAVATVTPPHRAR